MASCPHDRQAQDPRRPARAPFGAVPNATGQGVKETLREPLGTLAHSDRSRRMLALEGRTPLVLSLDELRQDRRKEPGPTKETR